MGLTDRERKLIQDKLDNFNNEVEEKMSSKNNHEETYYSVNFDFNDEEIMKAFMAWFQDGGGEYDLHQSMEQDEGLEITCDRIENSRSFMIRRVDEQENY